MLWGMLLGMGLVVGVMVGVMLIAGGSTEGVLEDKGGAVCAESCTIEQVVAVARREGAVVALAELKRRVAENPELSLGCHGAAHAVGMVAGERDWPEHIDGTCFYGYLHGVLQVRAELDGEEFVAGAGAYCSALRTEDESLWIECLHGIGHGVAIIEPTDIVAALQRCGALESVVADTCASGVMMEYAEGEDEHSEEFSPEGEKFTSIPAGYDTDGICRRAPEATKESCYEIIWSIQYARYGSDMVSAVRACTGEVAAELRAICLGGFAGYVINLALEDQAEGWGRRHPVEYAEKVLAGCLTLPEAGPCVRRAAYSLYSEAYFLNDSLETAPPLCEQTAAGLRRYCLEGRQQAERLYLNRS